MRTLLAANEPLAAAIVDAVRHPLLVLDTSLNVLAGNRAYFRVFRTAPDETVGRPLLELGGGAWNLPDLRQALSGASAGAPFDDHIVEASFPRIGARTMVLDGRIIRGVADMPLILLAIEDETVARRAQATAAAYTIELRRSNRALEEFATIASHDLQEPLRKIVMFGDRLRESTQGTLTDRASDALDRMLGAATRMQQLINGLLGYSRIATRRQGFAPVDLNAEVDEVLDDLESIVHQCGAVVRRGSLPTIQADGVQVRQLFQNLIGNALKFRRPGEAPLIMVDATDGPGDSVQITVTDNGIGFDERYAERIFGIFQRLHGRSEYEGTGIGLAICRRIVERHGGTIEARSTLGGGATFIVTLPRHPDQDAVPLEEPIHA